MIRFVLRRLGSMLLVLIATVALIFTLMYFAPGDPALTILGETATEDAVEKLHEELGLNDPFFVRLGKYLLGLAQGDFGTSYRTKGPVFTEIMARYPTTLKITFGSMIVGMLIGVSIGIVSAVKQYSVFDRIFTAIALFGASAPSFWIAMLLTLVFSIKLGWLPATGSYGFEYWILPILTMGFNSAASIMRMTRSAMLEVVRQDYIRTARSKGQTELVVIIRHALKNALIPILTVTGIKICAFLGGSVLSETVFALPGLGKYIVDSVAYKDYPVVQGAVTWICLNCVLVTFIVDLLYGMIDPRIRLMYGGKKKRKNAMPANASPAIAKEG